jgi:hypothetical protein
MGKVLFDAKEYDGLSTYFEEILRIASALAPKKKENKIARDQILTLCQAGLWTLNLRRGAQSKPEAL